MEADSRREPPPVSAEGGEPGNRVVELVIAGALGAFLTALGLLKLYSWEKLSNADHAEYYIAAAVLEIVIGLALILAPRGLMALSWRVSSLFCMTLFFVSFLGAPLPECQCFGVFAEMGQSGRTALAASMAAVALLGTQVAGVKFFPRK